MFSRLDRDLWDGTYQNPVLMLGTIAQERLEALARDESFLSYYDRRLAPGGRGLQRTGMQGFTVRARPSHAEACELTDTSDVTFTIRPDRMPSATRNGACSTGGTSRRPALESPEPPRGLWR